MDLISELKRRQQKEPLIYESDRDGAIEDIITGKGLASPWSYPQSVLLCFLLTQSPTLWGTGCHTASCYLFCFSFLFPFSTPLHLPHPHSVIKTVPFTARTGKRTSRLLCEASLGEEMPL